MKKKETGVSTETAKDLASYTQKDIPGMLKLVVEKIKQLSGNGPVENSTKGKVLSGFDEIDKIESVSTLIAAHSSVNGKANAYKASAEALGIDIKKYPFKLDGCTAGQWNEDIKTRIAIVANKAELVKLQQTKALLEANLSAEAKLATDLKKIAELLAAD